MLTQSKPYSRPWRSNYSLLSTTLLNPSFTTVFSLIFGYRKDRFISEISLLIIWVASLKQVWWCTSKDLLLGCSLQVFVAPSQSSADFEEEQLELVMVFMSYWPVSVILMYTSYSAIPGGVTLMSMLFLATFVNRGQNALQWWIPKYCSKLSDQVHSLTLAYILLHYAWVVSLQH